MQDAFDIYDENVFKAANGMGAGLAYKRDTCGVLLGGYLMLGLQCGLGREELARGNNLHPSYPIVQQFYDWFNGEFGSTKCADIFGKYARDLNVNNINLEEMRKKDSRNKEEQTLVDAVHLKCNELSGKVASHITEILWDLSVVNRDV